MLEGFGFPILAIIVILVMVYFILNKNKIKRPGVKTGTVWKWTLGFAIYALVPLLLAGNFVTHGENSPLYILWLPIFWPLIPLIFLSSKVLYILIGFGLEIGGPLANGSIMVINIFWAALLGMFIGLIIKKVRKKNEK